MYGNCPFCDYKGRHEHLSMNVSEWDAVFVVVCPECGTIWGNNYDLEWKSKEIIVEGSISDEVEE